METAQWKYHASDGIFKSIEAPHGLIDFMNEGAVLVQRNPSGALSIVNGYSTMTWPEGELLVLEDGAVFTADAFNRFDGPLQLTLAL